MSIRRLNYTINKLVFSQLTLFVILIALAFYITQSNFSDIKAYYSSALVSSNPQFGNLSPVTLAAVAASDQSNTPTPSKELENIVSKEITDKPSKFGIIIKNLNTGEYYNYNENEVFTSASLYKIAVMYTLFKLNHEGKLDINKSDIQQNIDSMITVSSNEAALYLVNKYTSFKEVTQTMQELGLKDTDFRKVPLRTTPSDMAKLVEIIALGTNFNMEENVKMLQFLAEQQKNDRIPANLPEGTLVAHKTGELEDVRHDAGLVKTANNSYIIVLMTKDSPAPERIKSTMAKISEDVYNYFESK